MSKYLQNLMARGGYMEQNNGEGSDLGGGGSGTGGENGGTGGEGSGGVGGEGSGEKKPSDAEAKLIKEVMDKKNKLKAAEETANKLQTELKRFEGIDPDAVRALIQQQKDNDTKKLEEKGEWERLKSQMAEEHGKEKGALAEQNTTLNAQVAALNNTIAELTVGNAFAQSQYIRDELALTPNKSRIVYGTHFEFKDGKIIGFDKPAGAANRTVLVNASGDPLSFEAALKKIVDADPDRDDLLKSKMRSGAGSKTSANAGLPGDKGTEQKTGKDRIAQALSKGQFGKK